MRFQQYSMHPALISRRYASLADEETPQIFHPDYRNSARESDLYAPTGRQSTARAGNTTISDPWHGKVNPHGMKQMPRHENSSKTIRSTRTLWSSEGEPLSPILLRDACRCSRCVDSSTQQRNFSFVDIPGNVRALPEGTSEDGNFIVKWENDISGFTNHVSSFSLNELEALAQGRTMAMLPRNEWSKSWDAALIAGGILTMSYEDYMTSDERLLTATKALKRDGLVFVNNIPSSNESINKIVERIGPLRNTFYGSTWDVKSKPNADNVAYTDKDLGFHMDLLYMREVPTYQFLHCIQNSCTGGESRFADTIRAREIMKADHPDQDRILQNLRIRYQYHNMGHTYTYTHAVFDQRVGVFWSPPFAESFGNHSLSHTQLQEALSATKIFASILERQDLVYETKMEEGTCAIFKNTRVVHARNAFDVNSGHRWLRGAYLDGQPLNSTYYRLMSRSPH